MLKPLFWFIAIFFISSASADSNFFKKYPGQASNCGYALALSSAGNIAVAGLQYGTTDNRSIIQGQMDLDGKGTTLYSYDTGRPDDTVSAVAPTRDGGFIIAANTSGSSSFRDILIIKVRSNGSIAWKKRITTANQEIVYGITTVPGGYVLAGASAAGSNIDALLIKINEAGTIVWKKLYGNSEAEFAYSAAPTDDGGLIMAAVREDAPFVLKLNASGRRTWGRIFPKQIFSSDGRVSIVKSGSFYYLVGTSLREGHSHGGLDHTGISVSKLTTGGELVWTREYHADDATVAWNATAGLNGNIIIAGHAGAITSKAVVFEINPDGKIKWKRAYFAENSAAFNVSLGDSSTFITGCTGRERLELFVAKIDTRGNIPQACGRWRSIAVSIDVLQDEISAFSPAEKSFPGSVTSATITTRNMNSGSKDLCN
jgi:hypothetical protein